jgi:hypothetical protein
MKYIKAIISIISIIMLRGFLIQSIHGLNPTHIELNQEKFKYEIFSVQLDENDLIIEGYAFVIEQQHYRTQLTHMTYIELLTSKGNRTTFTAVLLPSNYTSHMQYRGTPLCTTFRLRQSNTTCHYDFENVQFRVKIPRSVFIMDEIYRFNLISHGRTVNTTFKTPIQAIVKDNIITIDEKSYIFNGSLEQSTLRIAHSEVVVRDGPSLESSAIYQGDHCSTTYRNQLFYQKDSLYNDVRRVTFNSNVGLTYYELAVNTSTCINSRRTVIEGSEISPVYINRLMVELTGTPLTLEVKPIDVIPIKKTLRFYHPLITKNVQNNHIIAIY